MGKSSPSKKKPSPLLDLHGHTTDEVFDALEGFLRRHESKSRAYVMTGKGSGKVKSKVIEYLKLANYSYSVFRDERGQPNEGILTVHMD